MQSAQKWLSPYTTPVRNRDNQNTLRKNLLQSRMRNHQANETPKMQATGNLRGPIIPTQGGNNGTTDVFGPAIKRRINFMAQPDEMPKRIESRFLHEDAIYIRYVNPQITSDKMFDIIKLNTTLKEAIENDGQAIEVTRLVKGALTEEQISGLKYGVSYRIGCKKELMDALTSQSNWATHWETRLWDPNFKRSAGTMMKNHSIKMI